MGRDLDKSLEELIDSGSKKNVTLRPNHSQTGSNTAYPPPQNNNSYHGNNNYSNKNYGGKNGGGVGGWNGGSGKSNWSNNSDHYDLAYGQPPNAGPPLMQHHPPGAGGGAPWQHGGHHQPPPAYYPPQGGPGGPPPMQGGGKGNGWSGPPVGGVAKPFDKRNQAGPWGNVKGGMKDAGGMKGRKWGGHSQPLDEKAARMTKIQFNKSGDLCVKLYETDVCIFRKNLATSKCASVEINSGGFHTPETKAIIRECLHAVDLKIRHTKRRSVVLKENPNNSKTPKNDANLSPTTEEDDKTQNESGENNEMNTAKTSSLVIDGNASVDAEGAAAPVVKKRPRPVAGPDDLDFAEEDDDILAESDEHEEENQNAAAEINAADPEHQEGDAENEENKEAGDDEEQAAAEPNPNEASGKEKEGEAPAMSGEDKESRRNFLVERLAMLKKKKAEQNQKQKAATLIKSGQVVASSSVAKKKGPPCPWTVYGRNAAGEHFEIECYDGIVISLPNALTVLGKLKGKLMDRMRFLRNEQPLYPQRGMHHGGPPGAPGAPPHGGPPPPGMHHMHPQQPAPPGAGVQPSNLPPGVQPGQVIYQIPHGAAPPPNLPPGSVVQYLPPGQVVHAPGGPAQAQIVHVLPAGSPSGHHAQNHAGSNSDNEDLKWGRAAQGGTSGGGAIRLVSAAEKQQRDNRPQYNQVQQVVSSSSHGGVTLVSSSGSRGPPTIGATGETPQFRIVKTANGVITEPILPGEADYQNASNKRPRAPSSGHLQAGGVVLQQSPARRREREEREEREIRERDRERARAEKKKKKNHTDEEPSRKTKERRKDKDRTATSAGPPPTIVAAAAAPGTVWMPAADPNFVPQFQ
ncbi:unnamed protein product [Amoebophrya sp. A120]|nr:unnamed protein product [Amoebophrya sp. A120]|eukprot:GSA120T00003800001.1